MDALATMAAFDAMVTAPTIYEALHGQDNGLVNLDEYLDIWYADTDTVCRHDERTVWCQQYGWRT